MKKLLVLFIAITMVGSFAYSQDKIRGCEVGLSFNLYDFVTADLIRKTSLSAVLRDESWARMGQMTPGVSIHYFKGLTKNADFAGTISGTIINYPLANKPNTGVSKLLVAADASAQFRLVDENFWFQPFVSVGAGAHKLGSYWGAYAPLGLGFNIDILNEGKFFVSSQYRVPVTTESASRHYFHSIGITSKLSK